MELVVVEFAAKTVSKLLTSINGVSEGKDVFPYFSVGFNSDKYSVRHPVKEVAISKNNRIFFIVLIFNWLFYESFNQAIVNIFNIASLWVFNDGFCYLKWFAINLLD